MQALNIVKRLTLLSVVFCSILVLLVFLFSFIIILTITKILQVAFSLITPVVLIKLPLVKVVHYLILFYDYLKLVKNILSYISLNVSSMTRKYIFLFLFLIRPNQNLISDIFDGRGKFRMESKYPVVFQRFVPQRSVINYLGLTRNICNYSVISVRVAVSTSKISLWSHTVPEATKFCNECE